MAVQWLDLLAEAKHYFRKLYAKCAGIPSVILMKATIILTLLSHTLVVNAFYWKAPIQPVDLSFVESININGEKKLGPKKKEANRH